MVDARTERIRAGLEQRLDRLEAGDHPGAVPFVDRRLIVAELLQIVQRHQIVERMDVARDDLRHRAHMRALERVDRQQRRFRIDLFQILDDRKRLDDGVAARQRQRRNPHLRIDRADIPRSCAGRRPWSDGSRSSHRAILQVERDAHPIGGRRAEIGIELHAGSWRCRRWSRPVLRLGLPVTRAKMTERRKRRNSADVGSPSAFRFIPAKRESSLLQRLLGPRLRWDERNT